jgi:hydroxymethylglutaryl-CoA lyase
MSSSVRLVEVGPRDGLQNEKALLSVGDRIELIRRLLLAGVKRIEGGAFVSPKWVPQMANSDEVFAATGRSGPLGKLAARVEIAALVPNLRGFLDARSAGAKTMAVFASATESFSRQNINCSIDESFERFASVFSEAKKTRTPVRGYLSMCFGCPFEGEVNPAHVVKLAERLLALGAFEVSIGDTIGVADPRQVQRLVERLKRRIPIRRLALHFHDTRGTALANLLAGYQSGVRVFDTSIGGLGGCPYAPNATGNVATEDVVYMLHGMGVSTGLDPQRLIETTLWIEQLLGRQLPARLARAGWPPYLLRRQTVARKSQS